MFVDVYSRDLTSKGKSEGSSDEDTIMESFPSSYH